MAFLLWRESGEFFVFKVNLMSYMRCLSLFWVLSFNFFGSSLYASRSYQQIFHYDSPAEDLSFEVLAESIISNEAVLQLSKGNLWLLDERLTDNTVEISHPFVKLISAVLRSRIPDLKDQDIVGLARKALAKSREQGFVENFPHPEKVGLQLTPLEGNLDFADYAFKFVFDDKSSDVLSFLFLSSKDLVEETVEVAQEARNSFEAFLQEKGDMLRSIANWKTESADKKMTEIDSGLLSQQSKSVRGDAKDATFIEEGDVQIGDITQEVSVVSSLNDNASSLKSFLSSLIANNLASSTIMNKVQVAGEINIGGKQYQGKLNLEDALRGIVSQLPQGGFKESSQWMFDYALEIEEPSLRNKKLFHLYAFLKDESE